MLCIPLIFLPVKIKASGYEDKAEQKHQKRQIKQLLDPQRKARLASYKLAFEVCKHKKPLSDCEHYIELARIADTDSEIFKQMVCSRTSII